MKKFHIHLLILGLWMISALALPGCGKKNDGQPTRQELMSKEWKVVQVFINGRQDQVVDYSRYRYQFNADGTYTFTEAGGVIRQGRWALAGDDQKIVLDQGRAQEQVLQILVLDQTALEWEYLKPANFKSEEQMLHYKLSL
jgi:hypothetical protein